MRVEVGPFAWDSENVQWRLSVGVALLTLPIYLGAFYGGYTFVEALLAGLAFTLFAYTVLNS